MTQASAAALELRAARVKNALATLSALPESSNAAGGVERRLIAGCGLGAPPTTAVHAGCCTHASLREFDGRYFVEQLILCDLGGVSPAVQRTWKRFTSPVVLAAAARVAADGTPISAARALAAAASGQTPPTSAAVSNAMLRYFTPRARPPGLPPPRHT